MEISGGGECELGVGMRPGGFGLAVRASGAAGLGAGAQSLVNDGLDGARASAAFGAAAEAAIDLLGIARKRLGSVDGAADILVADDVTGTNNHENGSPSVMRDPIDMQGRHRMQKEKPSFQAIPNCWAMQTRTDLNMLVAGDQKSRLLRRKNVMPL